MKRISAAVMAVALTVSCNIQEALDGDQGGQKSLTSFPDVIVASPKGMPGQTESSDPAVRTITPDGTKVYWEPGDQIALFPGTAIEADRYENVIYNARIDEPQLSATFVRDDVQWQYEEGDFYLAAYPASAVARWGSTATNACYAEIPSVQTARNGAWDSKAGVLASMSKTTVFEFSHVAAYLKFIVDGGTSPFVSAAVAYPDITQVVTGETSYVKASVTNLTQIKYAEDAITVNEYNAAADVLLNDYKKYDYPSSQAILNSVDGQPFSAGIYYIAILPRTYEKGLSVVFTSSDGKVAVKRISGPVTLNMGEVANVGTIGTLDFETPLQPYTIWSDAHAANQGVVFWVDEANPLKGLVVSTCTHNDFKWSTENQYYGAVSDSPLENHSIITGRDDYSADKFPAIAYCEQLRGQYEGLWRLPTIEEMRVLYNVYYGRNSLLSGEIFTIK